MIFVLVQQMVRVSLRIVTMQTRSRKIITRDNVSIDIGAAVAYQTVQHAIAQLARGWSAR